MKQQGLADLLFAEIPPGNPETARLLRLVGASETTRIPTVANNGCDCARPPSLQSGLSARQVLRLTQ